MTGSSSDGTTGTDQERKRDINVAGINGSSINDTTNHSLNTTVVPANTLQPTSTQESLLHRSPEHSFEMDESAVGVRAGVKYDTSKRGITSDADSCRARVTGDGGAGAQRSASSSMYLTRTGGMFAGATRHTVGLILLLVVVFLWTLSNFLGSSIFADASYAKPFFLTYLNTSIFVFATIPSILKWIFLRWRQGVLRRDVQKIFCRETMKSMIQRDNSDPLRNDNYVDDDDDDSESNTADPIAESEAFLKPVVAGRPGTSSGRSSGTATPAGSIKTPQLYLGLIPTARLSLVFCLLWFGANYFAMACLQYTTVASATILTSTSSVWTLLIGSLSATEKFTWRKLCGTLGSLAGIFLISHADLSASRGSASASSAASAASRQTHSATTITTNGVLDKFPDKSATEFAIGDALALLSALIYGAYTITLKKSTMRAAPLELHMPTFFGLVGIFNIVLLLPLFPILHITGIEPFELPPSKHIWTVLIVNSISSFASDIMWAYAMVLTSPLIVTVGLSLTIPLSLIGEMILQSRYESWAYWVGATIVVGSFVFVEREGVKEEEGLEEDMNEQESIRIIEEGQVARIVPSDVFGSLDREIDSHDHGNDIMGGPVINPGSSSRL